MQGFTDLERSVLDKLLSGDHPVLAALRQQAEQSRVVGRELTGVGFYCSIEVAADAPSLRGMGEFAIGDVNGDVQGLAHGAGFVLFIRDGRLHTLEGFSYDEPWPEEILTFTLRYGAEPRDLSGLPAPGSQLTHR